MKSVLISDTFFTLFCYKILAEAKGYTEADVFSWDKSFIVKAKELGVFNKVVLLPNPPRGLRALNPFQAHKTAYKNSLLELFDAKDYNEFFTHQISDIKTNLAMSMFKKRHPKSSVALLPDGTINMRQKPLTKSKLRSQKLKSLVGRIGAFPYQRFEGDWTGLGSELVDKIFLPETFPHEYPKEWVSTFEVSAKTLEKNAVTDEALFMDQTLVEKGCIKQKDYEKALKEIDSFFKDKGVKKVFYKPHPKAKTLTPPLDWVLYETKDLMDEAILKEDFKIVSSFTSTALLSVVFNGCRDKKFVAFDLTKHLLKDNKAFLKDYQSFEKLGCERVSV